MKHLLLAALLLLVAHQVVAADAYFVRFGAQGGNVLWSDDVLFFNTNTTPVSVRFVGVSNGAAQPGLQALVLAPGQSVSLNANQDIATKWLPVPLPPLWVLHLDVPSGVGVESRDEFYRTYAGVPELFPTPRGKVSLPVFRALRAANEQQVHLGTDLSAADSRVNVGVYNASTQTALATIGVRRTCDDVTVDTRTVQIAPNTVVQVGGLQIAANSLCTDRRTPPWMRAVTITVDQPSLTFVSNVNDRLGQAPGETDGLPVVGLAVTKSEPF